MPLTCLLDYEETQKHVGDQLWSHWLNWFTVDKTTAPMSGGGVTHHLASLLRWSGFPQREDAAADGDFPPKSRFGVLVEALARVHHQNSVGGQSVHLTVLHPPLGGLLLPRGQTFMFSTENHFTSHHTEHSDECVRQGSIPPGRCSWRSRSQRRRSGRSTEGFFGRWCGRRSGRWCSGPSDHQPDSDRQAPCPSPRSRWDSLSNDRSVKIHEQDSGYRSERDHRVSVDAKKQKTEHFLRLICLLILISVS